MLVVLDAELSDLSVDGGCDLLLRPLDLGAPLRRRAVLAVQIIATGFSGLRLLRQSQQHMPEEFIDVYGNYAMDGSERRVFEATAASEYARSLAECGPST
jgi:hypothetical protein